MTDADYPQRIAFQLETQCVTGLRAMHEKALATTTRTKDEDWSCPQIPALVRQYQNPEAVDKIAQAMSDVEEVKAIMLTNIDSLLARGESIDELCQKTDELRYSTKT